MIEPPSGEEMLRQARSIFLEDGGEMDAVLLYNSGETFCVTPCAGIHPVEAMAGIFVGVLLGKIQRPDWVAIATDSYHWTASTPEEAQQVVRGSLKERFEAGDPTVGESLMVQCMSKAGTVFCLRQAYHRDGDNFIFDEPEDMNTELEETVDGRMVQAMRSLIGYKEEK